MKTDLIYSWYCVACWERGGGMDKDSARSCARAHTKKKEGHKVHVVAKQAKGSSPGRGETYA